MKKKMPNSNMDAVFFFKIFVSFRSCTVASFCNERGEKITRKMMCCYCVACVESCCVAHTLMSLFDVRFYSAAPGGARNHSHKSNASQTHAKRNVQSDICNENERVKYIRHSFIRLVIFGTRLMHSHSFFRRYKPHKLFNSPSILRIRLTA